MQLIDLIKAVRTDTLTKEQTEGYYDQLCFLKYDMEMEMARLEKEEALYFIKMKDADPDESDVSIKRKWKASESGQKMILMKRNLTSTKDILSALKNRIYRQL